MKLFRFGEPGSEQPGLIRPNGRHIDASDAFSDYDRAFFDGDGLQRLREWAKTQADQAPTVPDDARLGPPIRRPTTYISPNLWMRYDPVSEVELAVIIGMEASYVSESEAMRHVAGYALHNDYSEREFQLERGGQWVKGKSCDTFAPLGPFLATPDEVEDRMSLRMWLTVNGERKQESSTAHLVFDVPHLVSYLSHFMTLMPGDIISTGTPAGVGLGQTPPEFLSEGDVVELGIDGLGQAKQMITAHDSMSE
jgi:2-keto-4-pentenoate hydratase/2-oxohepta-3-ene-1,7-dioic acid hydratase in catechol pathway